MLTKSGLDPKNFESNGVGGFDTGLKDIYTASVPTKLYTLTNNNGMEVCVTNFGCRIVSVMVPDKDGKLNDVVLGFDSVKDYADFNGNPTYFGCVVGRYANRIANGKFTIEGKNYSVDTNEGENMLHGGIYNWSFQTFDVEEYDPRLGSITFRLVSPDGDCGFGGEVIVYVTYRVTDNNSLDIYYEATTNKDTLLNLTNHTFFNLTGNAGDILGHKLWINSRWLTPVKEGLLPTGQIEPIVPGSAIDFYIEKTIGQDINDDNSQMKLANGYDQNFILEKDAFDGAPAATLHNTENGIKLSVFTVEPAMQFYRWNSFEPMPGKNGVTYKGHEGVCLETQNYPDAPNFPHFPSAVLRPGEKYESFSSYAFTVE